MTRTIQKKVERKHTSRCRTSSSTPTCGSSNRETIEQHLQISWCNPCPLQDIIINADLWVFEQRNNRAAFSNQLV